MNIIPRYTIIVSGFILAIIIGCSAKAPQRPKGIPLGAVLVRGADGGVWIICNQLRPKENIFQCQVFNDSDGRIWASEQYNLRESIWYSDQQKPSDLPVIPITQNLKYSGFDGTMIYLQDSLVMLPVK